MFGGVGSNEIILAFIIIVPWILLCMIVGTYAQTHKRGRLAWTITAILLTPIMAFLILLVIGEGNEHQT
jgi:hypothetical protein